MKVREIFFSLLKRIMNYLHNWNWCCYYKEYFSRGNFHYTGNHHWLEHSSKCYDLIWHMQMIHSLHSIFFYFEKNERTVFYKISITVCWKTNPNRQKHSKRIVTVYIICGDLRVYLVSIWFWIYFSCSERLKVSLV